MTNTPAKRTNDNNHQQETTIFWPASVITGSTSSQHLGALPQGSRPGVQDAAHRAGPAAPYGIS
eukprot:960510-Amphidinium_carterae.1